MIQQTEISVEAFLDNPTKKHIRLTRIQKLIGDRMLKSKLSKPCFYISSKADITELMAMRPKLRKSLGVKITTNAFYIRALGLAVQKYPLAAGKVDGDKIQIAEHINIGFAVNAPQGLVVPVIKDAADMPLPDIASQEALLTYKARDNLLTLEDIEGETVALSNLGAYGIDCFLGIVPPPASTILAVGNAIPTPVYQSESDKIAVRKIVSLSLAADQRVMNEIYAAEFLNFITQELQNPQKLV
ncbi:MAG: 2-oxo acid dehydrogenase subunit E2 [Planctomycetes bacterium]|nr:2-oxo acid dehydrogenase subunit E2 [Planctomycetota bacterium]